MLRKSIVWIGVTQALILVSSLVVYKRIDLLSYSNVSFVFGAFLILTALTGYVVKGRFFDIIFYSFQHFSSGLTTKNRRPLSELAPQNYYYPFISGAVTIILMLITLFLYQAE